MKKKILLADDEEIIRRGISTLIPWNNLDMELVHIAENGKDALEFILDSPVDIVITDIRMPLMDGLDLIRACSEQELSIRFILLTGYSEFEYARSAMQYGVRHYLVKPTDDTQIIAALRELSEEIEDERAHNTLFTQLVRHAPEDLFARLLTRLGSGASSMDSEDFFLLRELLHISGDRFSLALLQVEGRFDPLLHFALTNISSDLLREQDGHAFASSASLDNAVILLISDLTLTEASECFRKVIDNFYSFYEVPVSVTISDTLPLEEIGRMYRQVRENCVLHYYLTPCSILTPAKAKSLKSTHRPEQRASLTSLKKALSASDEAAALREIRILFSPPQSHSYPRNEWAELITDVYLIIQGQILEPSAVAPVYPLTEILALSHLDSVAEQLSLFAADIIQKNQEYRRSLQQNSVDQILSIIEEEIANPDLSLKWIAQNRMFMNENYLSRLFQKKTGQRFSSFLISRRMSLADRLLRENPDIPLEELCDRTGFANNPSYFSTVFKKHYGYTLTQYRRQF